MLESRKARLIAHARLAFCAVALATVALQPFSLQVAIAGAAVLAHTVFSLFLWRRARRAPIPLGDQPLPWVDFVCHAAAVEATGGLASPLLAFMLFPVAVATFQQGGLIGTRVGLFCASLFGVTLLMRAGGTAQLDVIPVVAIPLLTLAGTIALAAWGKAGTDLMRRLALMNDINRLFRPSTGLGSVGALARLVRTAYSAEGCLIMIRDTRAPQWRLYLSQGDDRGPLGAEMTTAAPLALHEEASDSFLSTRFPSWLHDCAFRLNACVSKESDVSDRAALAEAGTLLHGSSYISLPLRTNDRYVGRLFLVSRGNGFAAAAVRSVVDIASHAAFLVDNLRLVDELTTKAASTERKKISRDLHDRTIQPYLGLKLGLEALRHRTRDDRVVSEVDQLIRMASDGVQELREYVGALRNEPRAGEPRPVLSAIREQAEKLSRFHGIEAEVRADRDISVEPPMYDHILNIVREGLANIWRHSSSVRATVNMRSESGRLLLEFINDDRTGRIEPEDFLPKSIGERADELGGEVTVHREHGTTAVAVQIPQ